MKFYNTFSKSKKRRATKRKRCNKKCTKRRKYVMRGG